MRRGRSWAGERRRRRRARPPRLMATLAEIFILSARIGLRRRAHPLRPFAMSFYRFMAVCLFWRFFAFLSVNVLTG